MRRAGAFAVACLVGAACSAVPDVEYVDDDAGDQGDARTDSAPNGTPPEAGPPDAARTPVQSSDRCLHGGNETCCGSSLCDKKSDCEGPAKIEQCTTCAYDCANQRCCLKGGVTTCVAFLAKCPT